MCTNRTSIAQGQGDLIERQQERKFRRKRLATARALPDAYRRITGSVVHDEQTLIVGPVADLTHLTHSNDDTDLDLEFLDHAFAFNGWDINEPRSRSRASGPSSSCRRRE